MQIDCSKCLELGDDSCLRKFRKKVMDKFKLSDNFKIYNSQGITISEGELYFLNQEGTDQALVYVSAQSEMFDYESYIKMFKSVKKLGEGGYGLVFLGRHQISGDEYAIKFMMPNSQKADEADKAFREAQVLQQLKHPNIIKLSNVFQLQDTKIVLFMEHIQGGNLRDYLDKQTKHYLPEEQISQLMIQIGSAINYCHQQNIVHRDIKLENILINDAEDLSKGIKIIDFGISGKIEKSIEQHKAGTIRYCPPELISETSFKADPSFDVWSLGILLYRMAYGDFPFNGDDWKTIKGKIMKAEFDFPENFENPVSDTCKALIRLMLNKNPDKRPKLYQLIKHPWFQNFSSSLSTSIFSQNTMMNFFKQELKTIHQLRTMQKDKITDSPRLSQKSNQRIKDILKSENFNQNYGKNYKPYNRVKSLAKYKSPYSIASINHEREQSQNLQKLENFQINNQIRQSIEIERKNLSNLRQYRANGLQNYIQIEMTPKLIQAGTNDDTLFDKNLKAPNSTKNRIPKVGGLKNHRNLQFKLESQKELINLPHIQSVGSIERRSESTCLKSNQRSLNSQSKLKISQLNERQKIYELNKATSASSFRSLQVNNQLNPVNSQLETRTRRQTEFQKNVSQMMTFELPLIKDQLNEDDQEDLKPAKRLSNNGSQTASKKLTKRQYSINTGMGSTTTTLGDDRTATCDKQSQKNFKFNQQTLSQISNHNFVNKLQSKLNQVKNDKLIEELNTQI
ncbi:protein kinase domain containing protein [Stylonychia lemnae]|uniref:Protein kinase domain containing protein n=1 Tax=Stylonychia lemnae TaxID=5949 RepID=A0A078ANU5_STYLE|nr:protein kinase domain containing protein [Stylonychia lemnae]|eukprot:CDW82977.1 protein kinase domain containing protein [Stylonychia lemnae]